VLILGTFLAIKQLSVLLLIISSIESSKVSDGEKLVTLVTNKGKIELKLFCSKTPKTCDNFIKRAQSGKYDKTIFHRVTDKYAIQGGDPTGTGSGGTSKRGNKFADEIKGTGLEHNSEGILTPTPRLNGLNTVFGKVADEVSMNVVKAIGKVKVVILLIISSIGSSKASDGETHVTLVTSKGDIKIKLLNCTLTPKTCANFVGLSWERKYDGTIFHRVIDKFMIQGGDPEGTGRGGASIYGEKFEDEIRVDEGLKHDSAGVLSMANSGKDTNGSQFFITLVPTPHLDGKHTVFGKVADEESMKVLKAIGKVKVGQNDKPVDKVFIKSVECVAKILLLIISSIEWSKALHGETYVTLITNKGEITLELFWSETPKTCENFAGLARSGQYDNTIFHRVIDGFMIQGGDPEGTGMGGTSIWGTKFADEIVDELKHCSKGVLSMANSGKDTNGSQFFITLAPTPHLDGKHTVFGQVCEGMDVVDAIGKAKVDTNGSQLFTTLAATPHLYGKQTIFGKVKAIESMKVVRDMGKVRTKKDDKPVEDVIILSTKVHKKLLSKQS
ncbi:unnamed protein product, partial [Medioppia subpectinata]